MCQAILKAQYILTSVILMTVIRMKHYYEYFHRWRNWGTERLNNLLNEHSYKCTGWKVNSIFSVQTLRCSYLILSLLGTLGSFSCTWYNFIAINWCQILVIYLTIIWASNKILPTQMICSCRGIADYWGYNLHKHIIQFLQKISMNIKNKIV